MNMVHLLRLLSSRNDVFSRADPSISKAGSHRINFLCWRSDRDLCSITRLPRIPRMSRTGAYISQFRSPPELAKNRTPHKIRMTARDTIIFRAREFPCPPHHVARICLPNIVNRFHHHGAPVAALIASAFFRSRNPHPSDRKRAHRSLTIRRGAVLTPLVNHSFRAWRHAAASSACLAGLVGGDAVPAIFGRHFQHSQRTSPTFAVWLDRKGRLCFSRDSFLRFTLLLSAN